MTSVRDLLGLRAAPVAVAYLDAAPEGVPAWDGGTTPSGCTFWKHAQEATFYTLPSAHHECAVGAYTHHIDLPPERADELMQTVSLMVGHQYIHPDEVAGIPRLERSPGVVAYGPADEALPFPAHAVLVVAQPQQAMLLNEALLRAGAAGAPGNVLGRPACGVLPLSVNTDAAATSYGCTGSRMYAEVGDDEILVSVPGHRWQAVTEALASIVEANRAMGAYYAQHRQDVAS